MQVIETEADYEAALERAHALMDADFGTPKGEELDVLADLIEQYEKRHMPMGYPIAAGALRFRIDQQK